VESCFPLACEKNCSTHLKSTTGTAHTKARTNLKPLASWTLLRCDSVASRLLISKRNPSRRCWTSTTWRTNEKQRRDQLATSRSNSLKKDLLTSNNDEVGIEENHGEDSDGVFSFDRDVTRADEEKSATKAKEWALGSETVR